MSAAKRKTVEMRGKPKEIVKVESINIEKAVLNASSAVTTAFKSVALALSADLAPPVLSQVFVTIKDWEDNLKDLASNARVRLMTLIQEKGTVATESGTRRLEVEGWALEIRPQRGGLNTKKVEALIRAKKYDPATYMDAEISYKINPVKLEAAQKAGVLTTAELESCENEQSFALQRPKRIDNE